jgi:3-methyladenine DNA glycosylase AlkC
MDDIIKNKNSITDVKIQNQFFKNKVHCDLIIKNDQNEIIRAKRLLTEYKNEYAIINETKFIFD